MANKVRKRQVQIVVDVKSNRAIRAIKRLEKANSQGFKKIEQSIKRTFGPFKKFKDNIIAADAAFRLMSGGLNQARTALNGFLQIINASAEQRSGINRLRHAFTQLGSVDVPDALAAIEDFAEEQQRITRFGDDMTRSVAANLATLLSGTETTTEELISLTGLVQDIVEATGKGSEEVARQIAQIYSGNVEAIGELLPAQRNVINALRDQEGGAEAATAAFDALNSAFGGAAEQIDSVEQGIARLQNTWGDWLEALGDRMAEALERSGLMGDIQASLENLLDWVESNGPLIEARLEQAFDGIRVALGWAEALLGTLAEIGREEIRPGVMPSEAGMIESFPRLMAMQELARQRGDLPDPNIASRIEALRTPGRQAMRRQRAEELQLFREELRRQAEAEGVTRAFSNLADFLGIELPESARRERVVFEDVAPFEPVAPRITPSVSDRPDPVVDAVDAAAEAERLLAEQRAEANLMWAEAYAERKNALEELVVGLTEAQMAMLDFEAINQSLARSSGEAWAEGFSIATDALNGFATTLPRIMGESAESGAERIAAVFQFLGQAAQVAAAVGVAAKASTAWLGPLSQFFAMGAAAASFAAAMGSGGGGGTGRAGAGVRGAIGSEAADVLVGQRPEATRGGITRNIQINAGYVLNNTESRRQLGAMILEAQQLNEIRGSVVG